MKPALNELMKQTAVPVVPAGSPVHPHLGSGGPIEKQANTIMAATNMRLRRAKLVLSRMDPKLIRQLPTIKQTDYPRLLAEALQNPHLRGEVVAEVLNTQHDVAELERIAAASGPGAASQALAERMDGTFWMRRAIAEQVMGANSMPVKRGEACKRLAEGLTAGATERIMEQAKEAVPGNDTALIEAIYTGMSLRKAA